MTQEGLEQEINRIGHMLRRANEDMGLKTTLILVIEQPDGKGMVTAFEDGALKDVPFEVAMTAAEASEKARRYAAGVAAHAVRG